MSENTTTIIRLRPRWWQFIRRYRQWREDRALRGAVVLIHDEGANEWHYATIVDHRRSVVTMLGEPLPFTPTANDTVRIIAPSEGTPEA